MGLRLTPELAREHVGHSVMQPVRHGYGSRPFMPAKLVRVIDDEWCEVLPGGHRRTERARITDCRLTAKSFKTGKPCELAGTKSPKPKETPMPPSALALPYVTMPLALARGLVNDNGLQPIVRYTSPHDERPQKAQLIGITPDDRFVLRHLKTGETFKRKHGEVLFSPADQEEPPPAAAPTTPAAKAEAPKPAPVELPGDAAVRKAREEQAKREAAAKLELPPVKPAEQGPDAEPGTEPGERGDFVVYLHDSRFLWAGPAHGWLEATPANLKRINIYKDVSGARRASGRFNSPGCNASTDMRAVAKPDEQAKVARLGRVRYLVDLWNDEPKKAAAKAEAEAAAAAKAATPPASTPAAPSPVPAPASAPAGDDFTRWAKLMQDEAEAEALLLELRAQRMRAEVALTIAARRKALA